MWFPKFLQRHVLNGNRMINTFQSIRHTGILQNVAIQFKPKKQVGLS